MDWLIAIRHADTVVSASVCTRSPVAEGRGVNASLRNVLYSQFSHSWPHGHDGKRCLGYRYLSLPLVAFLQNIQQESKCQTPSSLSIKVIESVYKNVEQFLWMWDLWTNVSFDFIVKIFFFFWRVTLHRSALDQPLIKFLLKRHHVVTIRHRATPTQEPFSAQHQTKCLIHFYLKWAIKAKFDLN